MTNEEARVYFIDSNERIISVAKDENRYNYETQQIEDVFMRRTFEANELAIKALEQKSKTDTWSIKEVADALEKHGIIREQEPTIKIGESNFSQEQYLIDIQSAYDCGKSVIDKIRAEIEQNAYPIVHGVNNRENGMTLYGILQIIDKYKESEE